MDYLDLTATRCRFLCHGPDATRYLNGQVTQDIRAISSTTALPACLTNAKGKLEAELVIAATPDGYTIDAPASLRDFLAGRLEKYLIADDCQIDDITGTTCQIHLIAATAPPAPLPPFARCHTACRLGRDGLDILWPAAEPGTWLTALKLQPADPVAIEDDRILRAIPVWDKELDATTLPPEAGLELTHVSFSKGCYIGQEIISRLKSVGQVNRRLCLLAAQTGSRLTPGMTVLPRDPAPDARPLGHLTSVTSDGTHALALLRRPFHLPGTHLLALPNPESALSLHIAVIPAHPLPA